MVEVEIKEPSKGKAIAIEEEKTFKPKESLSGTLWHRGSTTIAQGDAKNTNSGLWRVPTTMRYK